MPICLSSGAFRQPGFWFSRFVLYRSGAHRDLEEKISNKPIWLKPIYTFMRTTAFTFVRNGGIKINSGEFDSEETCLNLSQRVLKPIRGRRRHFAAWRQEAWQARRLLPTSSLSFHWFLNISLVT